MIVFSFHGRKFGCIFLRKMSLSHFLFSLFKYLIDHCPWVNNCVGIGNHKYFLLFVFYTCLSCVYSLTLITMRFVDCMNHHGHVRTHHMTCLDRPTQLLNIIGLFMEAILFGYVIHNGTLSSCISRKIFQPYFICLALPVSTVYSQVV